MSGKVKWIIVAVLVFLLAGGIGSWFWYRTWKPKGDDGRYLQLLSQVFEVVRTRYVEPVEEKKLAEGAVNGMLAALDPHSTYLPPAPFKEMQVQISGSFGGIGTEINIRDGRLVVISPIEETPAWKGGVRAGDYIWRIDGKPTDGLSINECVRRLRGEPGTRVVLSIVRQGEERPLTISLVRAVITMRSVRSRTLAPGFGYLRISHFQGHTGEDAEQALVKLRAENGGTLKGLVLDLRNNPGGLLDQAIAVANRFLGDRPDNALIVYTRGRTTGRHDYSASVGEKEPPYPVVVLVNGGSASASEIVAGALQDQKRALVMGTQTFGKGSVQGTFPMKEGAGVMLTIARYYTPAGRSIQAKGIVPDVLVTQREFRNLSSASRPIREQDLEHVLGAGSPAKPSRNVPREKRPVAPALPAEPTLADDYQLARALEMLQGLQTMRERFAPSPAPPAGR